jgi:S1-C subfamily serine protease
VTQFELIHCWKNQTFRTTLLTLAIGLCVGTASAEDYSDLFANVDPSVVTIQTSSLQPTSNGLRRNQGIGSGTIVGKNLILTAAHVVDSADQILVKFVKGQVTKATVVSSIRAGDVALLRVRAIPDSAKVARIGDSDKVRIGSESLVIGAPLGVEHSLSIGHVSGKTRRPIVGGGISLDLIQTDASINPGNSGGPIFNRKGEVIGVVSHILSESGGSDGVGFGVAINAALQMVRSQPSFWTGFEAVVLGESAAALLNVPQAGGLLVQRVETGSPAAKAGLRAGTVKSVIGENSILLGGDVILEIQQDTCQSHECVARIRKALSDLKPDAPVTMKVLRGGKILTLKLERTRNEKTEPSGNGKSATGNTP